MNLLESTYHDDLRATYQKLRAVYNSKGLTLPKNQKIRHDLDCLINRFARTMAQKGFHFQTVRGAFEEGRLLFPGSAIRKQSHVQIAVRDFQCIRITHV